MRGWHQGENLDEAGVLHSYAITYVTRAIAFQERSAGRTPVVALTLLARSTEAWRQRRVLTGQSFKRGRNLNISSTSFTMMKFRTM